MRHGKQLRIVALTTAGLLVLGTAAASAASKIGTNGIQDGAVTSAKIKNATVQSVDVKDGAITSTDIANGTVTSSDIKDSTVTSADIANGTVTSTDIKDSTVTSTDIKDGTVGAGDLANGSVTANKIAPGAIAFPNALWGTVIRNQAGAAQSGVQTGPTGAPMGSGSLSLITTGTGDLAAFGDSFDFAGFLVKNITSLSYWSYNNDTPPLVRPSLRIEINPHLVDDSTPGGVLEFSTLTYEPDPGTQGWVHHTNIQNDQLWYLTGDDGTTTGCTQGTPCTLQALVAALAAHNDGSGDAAISSGVYFGLGSGVTAPTATAVDDFQFNNFVFDFEPTGVFMTSTS